MILVKTFASQLKIFHAKNELDELDRAVNDFLASGKISNVVSVSDAVTTGSRGEAIGVIRVVAYEAPAAWREEYHERIDRRIRDWGDEIEKLRGKAETLGAGARARLKGQVDELKTLQETAQQQLSRMRKAGEEAWGDLHAGAEQALEELRKGYETAAAKLKK
ncbi:MAG: hypothetical protein HZB86_01890 [Deltaproteobacteria bacterium]|nr:hypothetical protein [Deltaproteobacteria bacterium]